MKSIGATSKSNAKDKALLNAKRWEGKPLRQPSYSFRNVPRCEKDLAGSQLLEVTHRDAFNNAMAEMVLLCKEAMRRNSEKHNTTNNNAHKHKRTTKPLSLEYMADRLDVDDPIFGYLVRTNTDDKMLQGFVTVTTFTNWQKTFRWDSMHDSAFSYDEPDLAEQMASGQRPYDVDGSLAEGMQATVRCGDPWNEGIVHPRIAEISLLGGLGCGKALVSLVIEKLECMNATGKRNYDYVALQATDNSISFYESMGFVRVGCITEDDQFEEKQKKKEYSDTDDEEKKTDDDESPDNSTPIMGEVVSSPVIEYETKKAGELPVEIAKRFDVNVWDIIFLNQYIYPDIVPRSRLHKGTRLFVPSDAAKLDAKSHASSSKGSSHNLVPDDASAPQWYIAKENDTPRMISKMFHVDCNELVGANRERHPELQANSRLRDGTRIKVSHFHIHDDKHIPYCHWTFPDDTLEHNEPSYMMARRLNRRRGALAKVRPVESSLAVPIAKHEQSSSGTGVTAVPTSAAASITPVTNPPVSSLPLRKSTRKKRQQQQRHPEEPVPPKRALSSYMLFCSDQRESLRESMAGQPGSELTKVLSAKWKELDEAKKAKYQAKHEKERTKYQKLKVAYQKQLAEFRKAHPDCIPQEERSENGGKRSSLFNKVVKLKSSHDTKETGSEFEYYYVLTYIPDLQWCHLAPMRKVGRWGPDKPKAEGRPVWMLVDEKEGKELDISASFCEPVRARSMKRTVDADQEQWDIPDSGPPGEVTGRCKNKENGGSGLVNGVFSTLAAPFTNSAKDRIGRSKKNGVSHPVVEGAPSATVQSEMDRSDVFRREMSSQAVLLRATKRTGIRRPGRKAGKNCKAAKAMEEDISTRRSAYKSQEKVQKTERAQSTPLAEGMVVAVQARMWPGVNKPGGVARITKVHKSDTGTICYDLKYVLGGKEKNVDAAFVSLQETEAQLVSDGGRAIGSPSSPGGKRSRPIRRAAPTSLREADLHSPVVNARGRKAKRKRSGRDNDNNEKDSSPEAKKARTVKNSTGDDEEQLPSTSSTATSRVIASPKRRGRPPKYRTAAAKKKQMSPKRQGRPPKNQAVAAKQEQMPPKRMGRLPKNRRDQHPQNPAVCPHHGEHARLSKSRGGMRDRPLRQSTLMFAATAKSAETKTSRTLLRGKKRSFRELLSTDKRDDVKKSSITIAKRRTPARKAAPSFGPTVEEERARAVNSSKLVGGNNAGRLKRNSNGRTRARLVRQAAPIFGARAPKTMSTRPLMLEARRGVRARVAA